MKKTLRLVLYICLTAMTLTACSDGGGGTDSATTLDTTAPTVSSASPVNNPTCSTSVNSAIKATFNEAMDPSTITTSTFTVKGVTGTVSYRGATATFTPSNSLAHVTKYKATITTDVKDLAGNAMEAPYTWTFTTCPAYGAVLDTSFDTDGIVTTAIGTFGSAAYAVAIQSDGKIIAAGDSHTGSQYDLAVVRYNTDGSLDTTFDTDGIVTTAIGTSGAIARALAIQTDGKIVAAVDAWNNAFTVVRYNTDGSLDTTFNTDGIVTIAIGTSGARTQVVAIQSDGKIVAAGSSYGNQQVFTVVRYPL